MTNTQQATIMTQQTTGKRTEATEGNDRTSHIAAMRDASISIIEVTNRIIALNDYRVQDLNDRHPMNDWRIKEAVKALNHALTLIVHLE